jgi:hypothetical protein
MNTEPEPAAACFCPAANAEVAARAIRTTNTRERVFFIKNLLGNYDACAKRDVRNMIP